MKRISAKEYFEYTGHIPQNDDLERVNCRQAGQLGHKCCGWCQKHNRPKFFCESTCTKI